MAVNFWKNLFPAYVRIGLKLSAEMNVAVLVWLEKSGKITAFNTHHSLQRHYLSAL